MLGFWFCFCCIFLFSFTLQQLPLQVRRLPPDPAEMLSWRCPLRCTPHHPQVSSAGTSMKTSQVTCSFPVNNFSSHFYDHMIFDLWSLNSLDIWLYWIHPNMLTHTWSSAGISMKTSLVTCSFPVNNLISHFNDHMIFDLWTPTFLTLLNSS